jgi:hypothetical protein
MSSTSLLVRLASGFVVLIRNSFSAVPKTNVSKPMKSCLPCASDSSGSRLAVPHRFLEHCNELLTLTGFTTPTMSRSVQVQCLRGFRLFIAIETCLWVIVVRLGNVCRWLLKGSLFRF